MKRAYFDLGDDLHVPGRWHLCEPWTDEGLDGSAFMRGRVIDVGSTPRIDIQIPGVPLNFTLTAFAAPVVSPRLAKALEAIGASDVQLIPVRLGGREGYRILNATRLVDCLDEERSTFTKWSEEDGREDLVGHYRMVLELRLDVARVPIGSHFFRINRWEVPLIVSGEILDVMRAIQATGIEAERVD